MSRAKLRVSSRLLKKKVRKQAFLSPKQCRFCSTVEQEQMLDYKNTSLLRTFLTERFKILPSRISGNCAFHQRMLATQIKTSRSMAMMPFCALHS